MHSGENDFAGFRRSRTSINRGLYLGTGVVVQAGDRFEIGPDVRVIGISIDNDNDPAIAYTVGLRVSWRM